MTRSLRHEVPLPAGCWPAARRGAWTCSSTGEINETDPRRCHRSSNNCSSRSRQLQHRRAAGGAVITGGGDSGAEGGRCCCCCGAEAADEAGGGPPLLMTVTSLLLLVLLLLLLLLIRRWRLPLLLLLPPCLRARKWNSKAVAAVAATVTVSVVLVRWKATRMGIQSDRSHPWVLDVGHSGCWMGGREGGRGAWLRLLRRLPSESHRRDPRPTWRRSHTHCRRRCSCCP